MSLKKELIKMFSNEDTILDLRYKWIWIFFLISVLAFSLNFFFIGAKFHLDFNLMIFPYIYTIFMISISMWFFFLLKWSFRNIIKWYLSYITWFACFIVFIILMLPAIMPKEVLFDTLSNYL